jgi:hypothetical protein
MVPLVLLEVPYLILRNAPLMQRCTLFRPTGEGLA